MVAVATDVVPLVGGLLFCDGLNSVLGGVLRASGRQTWGAASNMVAYWVVRRLSGCSWRGRGRCRWPCTRALPAAAQLTPALSACRRC